MSRWPYLFSRFLGGRSPFSRAWRIALFSSVLGSTVLLWAYVAYLDSVIKAQFEGKRWSLPARVFARPLELYPGMTLGAQQFAQELAVMGYHEAPNLKLTGTFKRTGETFQVMTRPFTFWDGKEASVPLRAEFTGNTLVDVRHAATNTPLSLVRFDPVLIGSIYPAHNEDRILIKLSEAPPLLIKALLAIEDRNFYQHHGIAVRAIFRAMFANLRAGETVQGASTITQQLVKNYFLSNERTLWRKFNEVIMSFLLEKHYVKNEILESYLNEIYLGQEGQRSIHGFGLASQFYFDRPLTELRTEHIALLIAIVKGPSFYDPRRNKARALQRRNLIIQTLTTLGEITTQEAQRAQAAELGVSKTPASGVSIFPAFMDLVRDQLRRDYREEDLTSEGLQIFTTLDPIVQHEADRAVARQVELIEKNKRLPAGQLQSAAVVVSVDGAEILAVVGGRDPKFAGFNRVRDAVRQIGSLVKPAVYLTALQYPERYNVLSMLEDNAFTFMGGDKKTWSPENFDHQEHGPVPLHQALAQSYNLATVRLGMAVGLPEIVKTLHALGVEREIDPYPSLLLGSIALTPLEVAQMYHTLANGGFRASLRTITAVLTADAKPLQRYSLTMEKAIDNAPVFLVTTLLQEAVREGTGRSLYSMIPNTLAVAGKTGTSNDLRDSWFAGYTRDKVAVVWMGLDDDRPAKLTGAEGALRVWGDLFHSISAQPGQWSPPDNVEMVWIDPSNNLRADEQCDGAMQMPFIAGSAPSDTSHCSGFSGTIERTMDWFKGLFE